MARLRGCETFLKRPSSRPDPNDNPYLAFGAITNTKHQDIVAAFYGRVLAWRFTLTFDVGGTYTATGISGVWTASGSYERRVEAAFVGAGSTEKHLARRRPLAFETECLVSSFVDTDVDIGSFTGTIDVGAGPVDSSGDGRFYADVGMSALDTDPAIPQIFSGDMFFPFAITLETTSTSPDFTPYDRLLLVASMVTPPPVIGREAPVQAGSLTITIPDWLEQWYPGQFPGTSSLTTTLWDYKAPIDSMSGTSTRSYTTLTIAIEPYGDAGDHFEYGFDSDDPSARTTMNRIWLDDGTAVKNPLNPG